MPPQDNDRVYSIPGIAGSYFVYISIMLLSRRQIKWKVFAMVFYILFSLNLFGLDIWSVAPFITLLAVLMFLISFVRLFQTAGRFGEEYVLGKQVEKGMHDPSQRLANIAILLIVVSPAFYVLWNIYPIFFSIRWGEVPYGKVVPLSLLLLGLVGYIIKTDTSRTA